MPSSVRIIKLRKSTLHTERTSLGLNPQGGRQRVFGKPSVEGDLLK